MEKDVEHQLRAPRLRLELIPETHDDLLLPQALDFPPSILYVDQRRCGRQDAVDGTVSLATVKE